MTIYSNGNTLTHFLEQLLLQDKICIDGLNEQIEGTGQGMNNISVVLTSETAGILSLDEFFVTYSMNTLNLDIIFNKSEDFASKKCKL